MQKNTIQKFVSEYVGNDLARDLANFIAKCENIKQERDLLNRELGKIQGGVFS
jgi:hypothetical protein